MKRVLRISCILILTVLILTANTVFSVADPATEAVDMGEVLTISNEKHAAYTDRLTDGVYNSYVSYASGEKVGVYGTTDMGYAFIGWQQKPASVKIERRSRARTGPPLSWTSILRRLKRASVGSP